MKIERHETGPRMSKAVIHGETVYVAGIVADGPKGKSVAEQTRASCAQIDGFLAMAGTDRAGCSRPISGSLTWRNLLKWNTV